MNLFNAYCKDLINEMGAVERTSTLARDIDQSGVTGTFKRKHAAFTDEEAIKQAMSVFGKGNYKSLFSNLENNLKSGNDDFDTTLEYLNLIRNLPDESLKKVKKEIIDAFVKSVNSPYHSFEQVKDNTVDGFKRINIQKIRNSQLSGDEEDTLIQNLPAWHAFYFDLANLLTRIDILNDPAKFAEYSKMDSVGKKNYIRANNREYFKPRGRSDSSYGSEIGRKDVKAFDKRDTSMVCFFDSQGNPQRVLIFLGSDAAKQYSTLKEAEDNVKIQSPAFQKQKGGGVGTTLGKRTNPPKGYDVMVVETEEDESGKSVPVLDEDGSYIPKRDAEGNIIFNISVTKVQKGNVKGIVYDGEGNTTKVSPETYPSLIGKTATEIKQIVNHDEAFEAFKKKYPPENPAHRTLYRGVDRATLGVQNVQQKN